jgi:hypothetical protein
MDNMILCSVAAAMIIAGVFLVLGYLMGRNSAGQPAISPGFIPSATKKPADDDGLDQYDRALMEDQEDVSTL